MPVNIGPKIGIDGEAKFRQQINNLIQQQKTLASEMRLVTASFDKNTTAEQKFSQASGTLNQQIKVQKERVQALSDMLQKSAQMYGENDTKTLKWREAVNDATAELNRMEQQVKDGADAFRTGGDGASTFGEVLRANLLSRAIVDGIKALGRAIRDMAGDFIESAASVKAEASQFEQTFGSFSDEATAAIRQVANESGILPTRLTAAGTKIYAFAKSSGATTQEAMEIMQSALQASADGAAYYDRSLEDTTETLQSFLKGNYENDAALGLSATETTRNAKAMELFGNEFKKLSETQKLQTLLQMVLDAQQLSGAMGQASRESDGWENVMGNLRETWRQFQAQAGTPFLENLIPIVQELTEAFSQWAASVDWEAIGQAITDAFQFLKDNGELIISIVAGIGAGFVAWNVSTMIIGLVGAVKTLFTSLQAGKTIVEALNIAMNANPIAITITLIAGLVAAFATLFATNEDFRNKVIEIWGNIKAYFSLVVESIVQFFTQTIPDAFNRFKDNVSNVVQNVKTAFGNMLSGIKTTVGNIKSAVTNGIQSAIDFIKSLPGQAIQWGKDFIGGLIDGIGSMISGLISKVREIADAIRSFLHFSRPDVGPLRDYETWMPDMIEGMSNGIAKNAYKLENAVGRMAAGVAVNAAAATGRAVNATYNMNVYGAPGQDVNALSEIVMRKIQTATDRKEAVWAQ